MTDYVADARWVKQCSRFDAAKAILEAYGGPPQVLDVVKHGYNREPALRGLEREINEELQRRGQKLDSPHQFILPFESMAHAMRRVPFNQRATRALTAGVGSQGGYLTESEVHPLIDALRPNCTAIALGAQVRPGQVGNYIAPTMSAAATAYVLDGETAQINSGNSSNQTFSQSSGTIHITGGYTELSRQALIQAIGLESGVTADLTRIVAVSLDLQAQTGTGVNGQILGVANMGGITSVSGTTFSLATAMSFISGLGNALDGSAGWSVNRAAAVGLRQRQEFSGSTRTLWEDDVLSGNLAGFPAVSTLNLASGAMLFGAWSRMKIPVWGDGIIVEVNPYANFQAGVIGVRAFLTADVCVDFQSAFAATTTFS